MRNNIKLKTLREIYDEDFMTQTALKYPNIPIVDYVHMEEWYWRNGGYSRDSYAFKNSITSLFL